MGWKVRARDLKVGTRAQLRGIAAIVVACLVVGVAASPAVSAAPMRNRGYWLAGQNEQVFAFGDGSVLAQRGLRSIRSQIVDMAADPMGRGYWLLGQDGQVYPYGDARDLGQPAFADQSAVALGATPTGSGYYVASDKGAVRAFGDAVDGGSLGNVTKKIADLAVTPSGRGYWLVDENGQVYPFGDATRFGSLPGKHVVGMAARPAGDGYWLLQDTGEVTAFGAAPTLAARSDPAKKLVDITATHTGLGYWLVDREGAVFPFGDAVFYSEPAKRDLKSGQFVAIVSTPFVNHDPVANTDLVSIDEDTTIDISVLANDTDEDGDPITAAVASQPLHGAATLNAAGTIHYAPA